MDATRPIPCVFVLHPLLVPERVEARDYQIRLAQVATQTPTLMVLPTGLGKTLISVLAAVHFLESSPQSRVLVLAPTKPLVEQHERTFAGLLHGVDVVAFTGDTGPRDRDEAWARARVVVATPQVVQNDVLRGARDLRDVSFIVFDEAHRATGNYPYVFLARRFQEAGGRNALGLTASPGADIGRVQTVLSNLGLQRVEVRSEDDADVKPFVHEIATQWVRVKPTPTMVRVFGLLSRCFVRAAAQLRRLGFLDGVRMPPSRKDLLAVARRLRAEVAQRNAPRSAFEATTAQARALKVQHALELAETQGLGVLQNFLLRVQAEAERVGGSRASRDFVREPEFAETLALCRSAPEPHPKVGRVMELVDAHLKAGARRVIVFSNFRETAEILVNSLGTVPDCRAHRFVGHATASGERGLTKKAQQEVVDRFRSGDVNVLVATSVAEEGLDLPETDLVLLYEPVASAIRMIQRRGRTGRRSDGLVLVLATEGTRDEQYHWAALRREKRMHQELAFLRARAGGLAPSAPTHPAAHATSGQVVEVLVDQRETSGAVPRLLLERGARIKTVPLDVGDYQTLSGARVERKSMGDFVESLKDGRLFEQARRMQETGGGILLLEGDASVAAARIGSGAFLGAVAAVVADHGLAVIQVPDAAASAEFVWSLARRAVSTGARRSRAKPASALGPHWLLQGLPGVGGVLADRLLRRFGSVRGVAGASLSDLEEVEGVGADRARTIFAALDAGPELSVAAAQAPSVGVSPHEGRDGSARSQTRKADLEGSERSEASEAAPEGRLVPAVHA